MIKELSFEDQFISCVTCDSCYGAQDNMPVFCQTHSFHIDPRQPVENHDRAVKCKQWFPLKRRYAGKEYEEVDRWYEKDSMG